MTELAFYDKSNITFEAALGYSSTLSNGFKNDLFFRTFNGDYFGSDPTVPEPQRSQFLNKLDRSWARGAKLGVMKGANELFLIRNGSQTVAACLCNVPAYKQKPLTWFEWMRLKLYQYYAIVADFLDGNPDKKLRTPERTAFFTSMYADSGAKEGPEYVAKLAELSPSELVEARYSYTETLYVHILVVRSDAQGKGYGSQILKQAIEHYKDMEGPKFTGTGGKVTQAPAKMSLFPTENNETFYNRYGFKTVSSGFAVLKGDEKFEHKFMQRLLAGKKD